MPHEGSGWAAHRSATTCASLSISVSIAEAARLRLRRSRTLSSYGRAGQGQQQGPSAGRMRGGEMARTRLPAGPASCWAAMISSSAAVLYTRIAIQGHRRASRTQPTPDPRALLLRVCARMIRLPIRLAGAWTTQVSETAWRQVPAASCASGNAGWHRPGSGRCCCWGVWLEGEHFELTRAKLRGYRTYLFVSKKFLLPFSEIGGNSHTILKKH